MKVTPFFFSKLKPKISFCISMSSFNLEFNKLITSKVELTISGPIPSPSKAIILSFIKFSYYSPLNETFFLFTKASIPFKPSFVFAESEIILASYSICPSRESKKLL